MQRPNKAKTCVAGTYCIINRTPLNQLGDGRKLICPVCGTVYDPDWVEPKPDDDDDDDFYYFYGGGKVPMDDILF